jgi:glycine cleavage system H protein
LTIHAHLVYTSTHEWIAIDGEIATVGITSHAAEALGDIVFVTVPAPGQTVTAGEPCGEVESTKAVSDLRAPVTGSVTETNEALAHDPWLINSDPYGAGWIFRVLASGPVAGLDAAAYAALTEGRADRGD